MDDEPEKSWESWWIVENAHLCQSMPSSRILEAFLSLCFFVYQYALVYVIYAYDENKNLQIYLLLWAVVIVVVGFFKVHFISKTHCVLDNKVSYYADLLLNVLTFVQIFAATCELG